MHPLDDFINRTQESNVAEISLFGGLSKLSGKVGPVRNRFFAHKGHKAAIVVSGNL